MANESDTDALLVEFWKVNKNRRRSMCLRDNCGQTAAELVWFLRERGVDADRVWGEFIADVPVHDFWDFTDIQHQDMAANGLNCRRANDRRAYMKRNGLEEELRRIPHYWVLVSGVIVDPVGQFQFVNKGLAADLDPSRYEAEDLKLSPSLAP